jgi:hypothetical protein
MVITTTATRGKKKDTADELIKEEVPMIITKKPFAAIILCAAMLTFGSFAEAKNLKPEKAITKARSAANSLLKDMKTAMKTSMKEGGLEKAFLGCSVVAQDIASNHSAKTGYTIRRTSLKYRNPLNKPTRNEKRVLKRFKKLNKRGKITASHENHSIVKEGKVKYLLYMRPLITKKFCLKCHGNPEQISTEIGKLIKEKYPKDKATGFSVGDIRGAVSVMIRLGEKP